MQLQQALARRHTLQTVALAPQRGVLLHLRDRHAGVAQAQQEGEPRHVFSAEDAVAVVPPLHAVEQPDALVVAQRVRRQAGGFCHLGNGQKSGHERSLEVRAHSKSSDFNANRSGPYKTKRRPPIKGPAPWCAEKLAGCRGSAAHAVRALVLLLRTMVALLFLLVVLCLRLASGRCRCGGSRHSGGRGWCGGRGRRGSLRKCTGAEECSHEGSQELVHRVVLMKRLICGAPGIGWGVTQCAPAPLLCNAHPGIEAVCASARSVVYAPAVVHPKPTLRPHAGRRLDTPQPNATVAGQLAAYLVTRAYIVSRTLTNGGQRAHDVARFWRHGSQMGRDPCIWSPANIPLVSA